MVLRDTGGQAAAGEPTKRTRWPRGEWEDRLWVEPGRSRLTVVCPCKTGMPRVGVSVHARLAFTMAAGHGLVQWHGLRPNASGCVLLSIAEFSW